ncbi:MAG: hypothetical protein MK116_01905 [Phycisphaerales bacterium]|nr:hypothetical protein [Phycisphaerales bacterium]
MSFDLQRVLDEHRGRSYDLHADHVNPQFAKVLRKLSKNAVTKRPRTAAAL